MARPQEQTQRLKYILTTEAKLDQGVVDFIMTAKEGPECASPGDFATLWSASSLQEGLESMVMPHVPSPPASGSWAYLKLRGRLEQAWVLCSKDFSGTAEHAAKPPEADDGRDKPWPEAEKTTAHDKLLAAWGLVFSSALVPNDPMMNRMARNWRSKSSEAMLLEKMKDQESFELVISKPPTSKEIAPNLFHVDGTINIEDQDLSKLDKVLHAMHLMANGWLILGTDYVKSKTQVDDDNKPIMVRDCEQSDNIEWLEFCRRQVNALLDKNGQPAGGVLKVAYLRERERQTRVKAIELWRLKKWPWSEAMRRCWEKELAQLWAISPAHPAAGPMVVIPGITDQNFQQQAKRQRIEDGQPTGGRPSQSESTVPKAWANLKNSDLKAHMLCRAFNSASGCTEKQRSCPEGKLHRCNSLVDGNLCGSQNCTGPHCSRAAPKGNPKGRGKGKKGRGRR